MMTERWYRAYFAAIPGLFMARPSGDAGWVVAQASRAADASEAYLAKREEDERRAAEEKEKADREAALAKFEADKAEVLRIGRFRCKIAGEQFLLKVRSIDGCGYVFFDGSPHPHGMRWNVPAPEVLREGGIFIPEPIEEESP